MAVRHAEAVWEGSLREGKGTVRLGSGAYEGPYSFVSRFEDGPGTNPEELIGAAHAGCFSMAFSAGLGKAGFTPQRIHTTAKVHLDKVGDGFKVTRIELDMQAVVPGIDEDMFRTQAEAAKIGCPISQLLTGAEIMLRAELVR
ncbi:MAG: OsmC family protein [Anaerolineae bacterium]|jgi:osmotically inducible protein OsmC|nr:OsmC family protein [Anaerolineae bacterium]